MGALALAGGADGISGTKIAENRTSTRRSARESQTAPSNQAQTQASGSALPFSIFWITDTQFLSEKNPQIYRQLVHWIVDNWSAYNGKLVIHTGDIVQDGNTKSEWANAEEAMSALLRNGIPYTWCAGNHDDYSNGDPTSGWIGNTATAAFNPSLVAPQVNALGYVSWAGDYHDGMNTAISFLANGVNFLVVNIEWNARPDVLEWVASLLDDPRYQAHRVILAPHAYMDYDGNLDDEQWGATLADFVGGLTPLMDAHPNIFLTLNGHFATECGYNTPYPINGRNQLMFDRQDCEDAPDDPNGRGVDTADITPITDSEKVGGATVTILSCDTNNNLINVTTYDVYAEGWRNDSCEEYSFTMFPTSVAQSSDVKPSPVTIQTPSVPVGTTAG